MPQKKQTVRRKFPARKEKQQHRNKPGHEVFFRKCADIAVVINLIFPVISGIILIFGLFYALFAVKENKGTIIYMILVGLVVIAVSIGITLALYRYFPSALCVLFILNVVFSLYSLTFMPKEVKV